MPKRNSADDIHLLREQYQRLVSAVDGYYAGEEFQALNVAVILRVLVHKTRKSHPLLGRMDREYWNLTIQHKSLTDDPGQKTLFRMPVGIHAGGQIVRSDLGTSHHQMVSLREWWNSDYEPVGNKRFSKQKIILDVANSAGGAHIDPEVSDSHAFLSAFPGVFGIDRTTGERVALKPNVAYGITADCGHEMQDCLERNFPVK